MMSASSLANTVTELAKTFAGQLLQPTDPGYEEARKVHNGLVDKRPALIARCRGVADIVEAVHLTRGLHLEVAVRSGGHNLAGWCGGNAAPFCGVRGGGVSFGIAASLDYRLHTVGPTITGGLLCYPLHAARDVLRLFREVAASAPDDLMLVASLVGAPDGSG